MNQVRRIAKEQGRTLVWIGKQIGKTRMTLNWKIEHDSFTPSEREQIARALGMPVGEVFPESIQAVRS